jgi:hypothetical protein
MDFTAKGLTSVIKIGLGDYESKLDKPITEHPDVQKLIAKMVVLQASHTSAVDACRYALTLLSDNIGQKTHAIAFLEQAIKEAEKIT